MNEVIIENEESAVIVDKRYGNGEGLAIEKDGDKYMLLDYYDSGVMCQAYDIKEVLDIITEAFKGRTNK